MPAFPATPLGERGETAIDILGNRIRVAIIGCLRKKGPSLRGDIAAELGLPSGSVSNQLAVLVKAGVIATDPPEGQIRPGGRVLYSVVTDRVEDLYKALGEALQIG